MHEDDVKSILSERFPEVDMDVLFDAANHPDATPVYFRYHKNYNEINETLYQEAISPIMSGDKTAEEAMIDVKDKITELINSEE